MSDLEDVCHDGSAGGGRVAVQRGAEAGQVHADRRAPSHPGAHLSVVIGNWRGHDSLFVIYIRKLKLQNYWLSLAVNYLK